jgi:hypothetical protein
MSARIRALVILPLRRRRLETLSHSSVNSLINASGIREGRVALLRFQKKQHGRWSDSKPNRRPRFQFRIIRAEASLAGNVQLQSAVPGAAFFRVV